MCVAHEGSERSYYNDVLSSSVWAQSSLVIYIVHNAYVPMYSHSLLTNLYERDGSLNQRIGKTWPSLPIQYLIIT